jgi:hypothetical protein
MTESSKPPVERAVEALLYAPLGLSLALRDAVPGFVDRGRAEIELRSEQLTRKVTSVRSMGEAAIAFGLPMVRDKAKKRVEGLFEQAGLRPKPAPVRKRPAPAPVHTAPAPTNGNRNGNGHGYSAADDAPSSGSLAIPGYDALSASQVVERLSGLATDELSAVRAYESSHRNRRTILGKIDQLTP